MRLVTAIIALLLASSSAGLSEIKYMVDGKIIGLNTSKAVKFEAGRVERLLKEYCGGVAKVEQSISALVEVNDFPLANSTYPASQFVGGFLVVRDKGLSLGFYPNSYKMIWLNLTNDGDKSFSESERDNVVALWKDTKSWVEVQCPK